MRAFKKWVKRKSDNITVDVDTWAHNEPSYCEVFYSKEGGPDGATDYTDYLVPYFSLIYIDKIVDRYLSAGRELDESMTTTIQSDLDRIFKEDAQKASLMSDYPSYLNNSSRYMLVPLLRSSYIREYYGVKRQMENNWLMHAFNATITASGHSIVSLLTEYNNPLLYFGNDKSRRTTTLYAHIVNGLPSHYHVRPLEIKDEYSVEIIKRLGIPNATKSIISKSTIGGYYDE